MGVLVLALYYIEQVTASHETELNAMPKDQEVLRLEDATRERNQAYMALTHWHGPYLPMWMRSVLVFAAVCMAFCCGLTFLFGSWCFEQFDVSRNCGIVNATEE
jgi:hypothetical protein